MSIRTLQKVRAFIGDALNNEHSRWYFVMNDFLAMLIVVSTVLVVIETIPSVYAQYGGLLRVIELGVVTFFALEYLVRISVAPNAFRYVTSTFGIIDLLAILPSVFALVLPLLFPYQALSVLRILRILRILRAFRLVRFVLSTKRRVRMTQELRSGIVIFNIELYLFALLCLVIISGSLLYAAESTVPGTDFTSIPQAMWWAVVTVTTVGYGDMVPVTVIGKIIASFTMFAGLVMFALLVAVMGRTMQTVLFGSPVDGSRP